MEISDILNLEEYIETSSNSANYANLENNNTTQIKEIYINSLKSDIKEKVEHKGYEVNLLKIDVADDEEYTLHKLTINISKKNIENNKNVTNKIEIVNEIKIGNNSVNVQQEDTKKSEISNKEKTELKEYLSSVYEINKEKIVINN